MGWNITQLANGDVELADEYGTKSRPNAVIGRGTTDTDITFLALRNADGELCYIYPNADQDAIVVSGTRP